MWFRQNIEKPVNKAPSTLMIKKIYINTFLVNKTPTNSILDIIYPIIRAISPPLKYSGKVVIIKWMRAVEAITAKLVWNINEFSQVFPSTIGWILKKGRYSLTKNIPLIVANIIYIVRMKMKITEMKDAPFYSISTRNLSIKTLLSNTSWANNLHNTKNYIWTSHKGVKIRQIIPPASFNIKIQGLTLSIWSYNLNN